MGRYQIAILVNFIVRSWLDFRFDFKMRIFYFCDINPSTNQLQCYTHQPDTDKFGELPGYVDHIVGYSISQEGMYFKDKSGGILFTKVDLSQSCLILG